MFWNYNDDGYDPFGSVRNLQREMNRIFNSYNSGGEPFPAINIWANEDKVVVTAELPGMNPDDIDVTVEQGQLSVSGERKLTPPDKDMSCHRQERLEGRFSRSFRLPFDVQNDKITAQYQDGILTVVLPRLEETKPKKISVKVK